MKISSVKDLEKLKHVLEFEFGGVPENIIIESKQIINECSEFMTIDKQTRELDTCIRVHDIKVMRGVAELF